MSPSLRHQDEVTVCVTETESPGALHDSDVIVAPICIPATTRRPESVWKIFSHTEDTLGDIPRLFWTHKCKHNTLLRNTRCAKATEKDDSF